jgi:hypothetical protein
VALLPAGEVLIPAGSTDSSAELYEPTKGIFTATGSMTRAGIDFVLPAATLLPDGEVLVPGGGAVGASGGPLASAELYRDYSLLWRAAFGVFWEIGR